MYLAAPVISLALSVCPQRATFNASAVGLNLAALLNLTIILSYFDCLTLLMTVVVCISEIRSFLILY